MGDLRIAIGLFCMYLGHHRLRDKKDMPTTTDMATLPSYYLIKILMLPVDFLRISFLDINSLRIALSCDFCSVCVSYCCWQNIFGIFHRSMVFLLCVLACVGSGEYFGSKF